MTMMMIMMMTKMICESWVKWNTHEICKWGSCWLGIWGIQLKRTKYVRVRIFRFNLPHRVYFVCCFGGGVGRFVFHNLSFKQICVTTTLLVLPFDSHIHCWFQQKIHVVHSPHPRHKQRCRQGRMRVSLGSYMQMTHSSPVSSKSV